MTADFSSHHGSQKADHFQILQQQHQKLAKAFKIVCGGYSRILYPEKIAIKCKGKITCSTCKVLKYLPLNFPFQKQLEDVLHQ